MHSDRGLDNAGNKQLKLKITFASWNDVIILLLGVEKGLQMN